MKYSLFIPLYIDKVKLFDLNSIINGGFNEFNEITISSNNSKDSSVDLSSGFNLFKINSKISYNRGKENDNKITGSGKYIQTSASMLSNVYSELEKDKIKKNINNCKIGDFVDLNLKFSVNSVLEVLKKIKLALEFGESAIKLDKSSEEKFNVKEEKKAVNLLINLIENTDNIVELVCETNEYFFVTYLKKDCLYYTELERINGVNLNYFAQIVDIKDEYVFCNDNILSEFSGNQVKEIIESINELGKLDFFSKNLNLVTSSNNKKIVLLDLISIVRKNN